ncbi:MAG TPA: DUF3078 domain-containing protein [Bacteroidota bacterium]|nr:DUF3078 domain-containing protein [Bacteroidota bacterium]
MKSTSLLVVLALGFAGALAQQRTPEEIEREKKYLEQSAKANADTAIHVGWTHTASGALNLTQVSFKDWVAGGTNTLAYSAAIQGASVLTSQKTVWTNNYRFAFGQARLGDQGLRKTDDDIYFESLLILRTGGNLNPYVAATVRTQFAPGYNYSTAPETQVSKFFDPGYVTESAGLEYKPAAVFTTRIGAEAREIFTSQFNQYATDLTTNTVHKVWTRGGIESVSELNANIAENIQFVARLDLFAPFQSMDRIVVRNDYSIVAKVNKYVSTGLTFNIINDVNVSPKTQMKQALALGLTYTLF